MIKFYKFIIIYLFALLLIPRPVNAQLIRQDDFQFKNDYWFWRSDGNQSKPTVENGLVYLNLKNAVDSFYCNTEFYDPSEPYEPGTQLRIRLKCSDIHFGSRGWGFWDGDADTNSLAYDFDVAWVMQQGSLTTGLPFNWFHFGVDGTYITNRQIFSLENIIEETKWHTYQINWYADKVSLLIDENFLYETSKNLPDQGMRADIWIDNRIFNINNPLEQYFNNVDNSEIFVDFVEISGINGPSIPRLPEGSVVLWDSPNTFPNGDKNKLWKQYSFTTTNSGEALIYLTGFSESYGTIMDNDALRLVMDSIDYGWNTINSLNGSRLNGKGASLIIPFDITKGEHNLDIYSDITPFLSDIVVVYSESSRLIYSNHFNESALENDGLWKKIEFNINNPTPVTIIVSGTGYQNDGIRLEFKGKDFGWDGEKSIDGNKLEGIPTTVILNDVLDAGIYSLKIYSKGNPQLYSIAIYGKSTITDIKDDEIISESIFIKANPNPFNSLTNILYKTNNSSHNKIIIVNILGQKIKTLVDEFQEKGDYNLQWNAINETSGIYFCILEADNYIKVEKLLLLK